MSAIRHFARWLAWHFDFGEIEHPVDHPPARITVFSSALRRDKNT